MSTTSERGTPPVPSRPADVTGPLPRARLTVPHRPADAPAGVPVSVDLGLSVAVLGPVPRGRGTARLALVVAVLALLRCVGAPSGVVGALAVGAVALAVVSLVTARPRRHGRATAVTAVVVAVVALAVASTVRVVTRDADEVLVAGLPELGASTSPEPAARGLVDLRSTLEAAPFAPAVVETATGPGPHREGTWWYVVVVENATPGYVVPSSAYEVVALRADGTVLDREVTDELELWPGRTALTGTFDVRGGEEVERVEVRGPRVDDGPRAGTPGGLRTEGVSARAGATTTVRGTVRSTFAQETDVHVTVVARDAQERVTGAATVQVGPVPARGRAQFEARFDRALPPTTRYEVYARP